MHLYQAIKVMCWVDICSHIVSRVCRMSCGDMDQVSHQLCTTATTTHHATVPQSHSDITYTSRPSWESAQPFSHWLSGVLGWMKVHLCCASLLHEASEGVWTRYDNSCCYESPTPYTTTYSPQLFSHDLDFQRHWGKFTLLT